MRKSVVSQRIRQLFVYRQLNRLLEEKSEVNLTREQRANLAEQVLNHAATPATVDQGGITHAM